MMRKTGGTAKTSVEMSCRRSWPFERVGWRRYGKPWRRWKPRRRRLPNRPRPKVVSTRGCPTTRPSVTSPIPSRRIIPAPGGKDFLQAYNCQAVVDSAHQVIVAARATNQTSDKQQAAAMMEETIDNVGAVPREVSADAGYYSAKAVDELYALGVDPFVAPEQTRHGRVVPPAPRGLHTQPSVSQGPDATEVTDQAGSAALRFADANCGAGIRPDQTGPGIPAVPAAGTGEGERRMVADLHRPQPAQTVPLWGQSAQESTGRWASPTHQELCRGSEHGAIRKAIWGPAGATSTISCRDPLSLTRKHR